MKRTLPLSLLALLLAAGAASASDASSILKCRALADNAARLSCYDAIPAQAASAPAAAAAPAPRTPEQSFGMETVKKPKEEEQPQSISSEIAGDFDGWGPNSRITLANGQVWRIVDGSDAVLPRTHNPKVRIERNLFGTLFLHVEGTNNSAKVRRVQ